MKKLLIAALLGATCLTATPVLAAPGICPAGTYAVEKGDNLSDLSANEWQRLEQANLPQLEGRRKKLSNGKIDVRIYPNECLVGVQKINGELVLVDNNPGANAAGWDYQSFVGENWGKGAGGLGLLLFLAALGYGLYLMSQLRRNPITSGPAQRQGGESREQVQQRFTEAGFRVTSVTPGYGNGVVNVAYGDRSHPDMRPRRLNNEPVFEVQRMDRDGRAMPNAYSLHACGNDVRSGLSGLVTLDGFRFSLQPETREASAPVPAADPVQAAAPAAAPEHPVAVNDVDRVDNAADVQQGRRAAFVHHPARNGEAEKFQYDTNRMTVHIGDDGIASIWIKSPDAADVISPVRSADSAA